MECGENEAGQAQHEEVQGSGRTASPEINEQPNGQIDRPNRVLVENGRIALRLGDDHAGGDLDPAMLDLVVDFLPGSHAREHRGYVDGALDG
jgi:hypothetical protein